MKSSDTRLLLILCLFLLVPSANSRDEPVLTVDQGELRLSARPAQNDVIKGQPIYVDLEVRNISSNGLLINHKQELAGLVFLAAYDANGSSILKQRVGRKIKPEDPGGKDEFFLLKPGYYLGKRITINRDEINPTRGEVTLSFSVVYTDFSKQLKFKHWYGTLGTTAKVYLH